MSSSKPIIWKPNPGAQFQFLKTVFKAQHYEVLYGGARGGGKTDAGIMSLLYYISNPLYRALVIRKNSDDLKDWSDRASRWYCTPKEQGFGGVRVGNPPTFTFPSGAIIRTGHLKDENSFTKYQGHEYHRILVEELTQIPTEENYLKLASSCRSTIPELVPTIISTCNPDGAGFAWVRKRFNIHGIPQTPIETIDLTTSLPRIFIPARLSDNPHLSKDTSYKSFLDGLPDGLREAWRDGSWNDPQISGGYFTMAVAQARRENRIGKVPYDPSLKVHTVWDLGIGEQLVGLFFQKTSSNAIHLIDSWQGANSDALPQAIAMLQQRAASKGYIYGKHFAPHDASRHEVATGLTVIDSAARLGVTFEKIDLVPVAHRIDKVLMMWPRLYIDETNAEAPLSAFMQYRKQWDERRLDWKAEPLHDWTSHFSDTLSYAALVEDQFEDGSSRGFHLYRPQRKARQW